MNYLEQFQKWSNYLQDDKTFHQELSQLSDDEKKDRFYCDLEFGTGGLRGILGLGTNRMNVFTVRKSTQGLANYLLKQNADKLSVAISFDSRINSDVFAKETAKVLAANGIKAWIYPRLQPTPALSYAVRDLGCTAGVCITASHNSSEYNGYKVYGADGCQITLLVADQIFREIQAIDLFDDVKILDETIAREKKMICDIPESTLDSYVSAVEKLSLQSPTKEMPDICVAYTPLNGTGLECVKRVAADMGIRDFHIVEEQMYPDGNFPTCPYPNPEFEETLQLGIKLCQQVKADLLIGTDPDCDRVGVAVPEGNEYRMLTGNEVGILLFDYICKIRKQNATMPEKPVAITTIVSSDLADSIAQKYGVELWRTLTGFKFIGEQIGALEKRGESSRFIFGFEESCGYLSGTHVRDKDGVNGVLLICEMLSHYKNKGKSLWQAMQNIYHEHGFLKSDLVSISFSGAEGNKQRMQVMNRLRLNDTQFFAGYPVSHCIDYLEGVNGLPKADVMVIVLKGGCKVIVRPSGTEPKIKIYLSAKGKTQNEASERLNKLKIAVGESMG